MADMLSMVDTCIGVGKTGYPEEKNSERLFVCNNELFVENCGRKRRAV